MKTIKNFILLVCLALFCFVHISAVKAASIVYTGVNLAGADFGENILPGIYNTHYTYPTHSEVDYFTSKGMNTFRLPFRWERLQQTQNAAFDPAEQARLDDVVNYATGKGAYVLLDPHNYARYFGTVIGQGSVSANAFADFWMRLANRYKSNPKVIFGLINEPNSMPTELWRDDANAAIAAIRAVGATNLILVPGNAWTGAGTWLQNWYGTPNGTVMLTITDPLNNYAFEVHQYLDGDSSGSSENCVSATIGAERLTVFTNWLKQNNRRGFLGEFAGGRNSTCYTALNNMLNYVDGNSDVWLGWTYWAAGPWWSDYIFTLEPTNCPANCTDRPQMAILAPHFARQINTRRQFDFDGDGKADVSVFRPDNGFWYLLNSTTGFSAAQFGVSSDRLVPADYDGDGKTDIAVFRRSDNSSWYIMQSSNNTFRAAQFGAKNLEQAIAFDIPVTGDFDGDGKTDLAVFRTTYDLSAPAYFLILQSSNNNTRAEQWGAFGDAPVPADYDGDGKTDVAVNRGGVWYLNQSSQGFRAMQFGTNTDKPVPADYDGDGKADIAVFRPSNGTWYLNQSQTGFTALQFGLGTDLPTPADYDGDGKTDIAVYRSGTWYLNRSTAGFTGVQFGASADKPVPNSFVP